MRYGKKFDYVEGHYYFTVKTSPGNITIYRKNKEAAKKTFLKYCEIGKTMEWHGKWDGKKFIESGEPVRKAMAE